jgi:hypothetical protein
MPIDQKYGRVTLERQRNIADDEPVIVFRAQDQLLPGLLRLYRALCESAGSPENHLRAIDHTARVVKEWQADHPTKIPSSTGYLPPRDGDSHA